MGDWLPLSLIIVAHLALFAWWLDAARATRRPSEGERTSE